VSNEHQGHWSLEELREADTEFIQRGHEILRQLSYQCGAKPGHAATLDRLRRCYNLALIHLEFSDDIHERDERVRKEREEYAARQPSKTTFT
jgi:hypothetical protein